MGWVKEMSPGHARIMAILTDPMIDPEIVKDSIKSLSKEEMADIVDGFAEHISDLGAAAAANDKRAKEFRQKHDDFAYQVEAEKKALEKLLRLHGDRKVQTQYYSVGIQRNGGLAPLVFDADVPAEYLIEQAPKVNNDMIRDALKDGEKLPFVHLGERGESLRIK